jgi:hypothetical protein
MTAEIDLLHADEMARSSRSLPGPARWRRHGGSRQAVPYKQINAEDWRLRALPT